MVKLTKELLHTPNEKTGITPYQRLLAHIDKSRPNGCWLYTGCRNRKGYGMFGYCGKTFYAHRVSMIAHGIPLRDDEFGLHKCDTPACCNPDHLFAGTIQDNMDDCVAKGRKERGSRCANSKLTEGQVIEIRRRFANWETRTELADAFGISRVTVSQIVRGHTWRHLPIFPRRGTLSGINNPMAKLTDQQVAEIRTLYAAGNVTQSELARIYDVSFQNIHLLVRNKSRKEIMK